MNASTDPMHSLLKAPIFEGLRMEDLEVLRPAVRIRHFNRGVYLFREGDPGSHLYMVTRGQVKIGRVGEGGGEIVFAIAGPGEIFGELSLFDPEGERTADAEALEPTDCIIIGKAPLLRVLSAQPKLLLRIIGVLSMYVRRKDASIGESAFLDIPGRVASKLIELADTRGRATADGVVIEMHLRQQTLAGMVGASRENVNRALRRFAGLGYIRQGRGSITVLDRARLSSRGVPRG
jgi:CRP/FNR family transcriptional regulator, cyclic AMP receptor protein